MKGCGIYVLSDNSLVITGVIYDPIGPSFGMSEVCMRVTDEFANSHLEYLILSVLDSTRIVKDLEHYHNHEAEIYKRTLFNFMNCKSYKECEKKSRHISIDEKDGILSVQEGVYDQKNGGFNLLEAIKTTREEGKLTEIVFKILYSFKVGCITKNSE